MPIVLPNLDDRTFVDLVEEARTLIPTHAPEWTDHNPSDPGITLVELFAYLAEILMYRLNRISDERMSRVRGRMKNRAERKIQMPNHTHRFLTAVWA